MTILPMSLEARPLDSLRELISPPGSVFILLYLLTLVLGQMTLWVECQEACTSPAVTAGPLTVYCIPRKTIYRTI